MAQPRTIITMEMLMNMEMLAVTNPAMKDILEQAKVIYALAGSPEFFMEDHVNIGSVSETYDDYENDLF